LNPGTIIEAGYHGQRNPIRKESSMKITNVKVIVTCPGRNYVLVKIETDDPGLYGVGDATLNGRELAVATALTEHLAPLLVGRDPDRIEDTWQYIFRGTYWRGGPVLMTALGGIDMALWDIKGKRAGLPLYSLLGGRCREGALCYTHAAGDTFEEVEENVRGFMDEGFKVVRAQVAIPGNVGTYGAGSGMGDQAPINARGGSIPSVERWEPSSYLRTIPRLFEHLRDKLGEEIELFHDVHERLTPIEAARLAKELEPYHLLFLEDPLRPEHKESFRLIRQHSTTPIGMGELFNTKWDCLPLITEQLIDYVRCGLPHIGGITEARKIAAIAECYQVRTAWHGPGDISPIAHAANVHLDLAIPNFGVQEMVRFPEVVREVISGSPVFKDGFLMVDEVPGLGCDIDEAKAAKYPYERAYLPVVRRFDGSVHDW
jgi:mannonate dehydratase